MSDKRIGPLLQSLPELQSLSRELQQLTALQIALAQLLPGDLASSANVALLKAGELILAADNGAVAAKLKLMAPRLLTTLRQRGYDITGIRLQVQVRIRDNPLPQKQISLSSAARDAIDSLSEQISPSPLQDALKRMGKRGKTSR
jgi:hypothetical protein